MSRDNVRADQAILLDCRQFAETGRPRQQVDNGWPVGSGSNELPLAFQETDAGA